MLQPVLVVLEVPDDTKREVLGPDLEQQLRLRGYRVKWAVPLQYTLEVPEGTLHV